MIEKAGEEKGNWQTYILPAGKYVNEYFLPDVWQPVATPNLRSRQTPACHASQLFRVGTLGTCHSLPRTEAEKYHTS